MDFNEEEIIHQELMREIAEELSQSTPMVLKGGTALLLGHGLSRHSTDLDYDSPKPMKLDSRVRKAVERKKGKVRSYKVTKAGASTTRAMVGYEVEGVQGTLKIEQSHREQFDESKLVELNGIRMYSASEIAEQKAEAMMGASPRSKARDAYDLAHLAEKNPEALGPKARAVIEYANNNEADFYGRYFRAFKNDEVLTAKDFDQTYLTLVEAHERMAKNLSQEERVDQALRGGSLKDVRNLNKEFESPGVEAAARERNQDEQSKLILAAAKAQRSGEFVDFQALAKVSQASNLPTQKRATLILAGMNRSPSSTIEKAEAALVATGQAPAKDLFHKTQVKIRREAEITRTPAQQKGQSQ